MSDPKELFIARQTITAPTRLAAMKQVHNVQHHVVER
jgi:hypothetical protein